MRDILSAMDPVEHPAGPDVQAGPLAVFGPYGPAVLRCGYQHAPNGDQLIISRPNSYRMIGVRDGKVVLQEGTSSARYSPTGVMLLQPGGEYRLELSPGVHLIRLTFDVVYQPREGHPGQLIHTPPAGRQPAPREVWGVDLPIRIPETLASQCLLTMELIRNEHWQRPAVYARACGRLALLLSELAAEASASRPSGGSAGGYWAHRVERLVRDRKGTLPTVTRLARSMGVTREHLSRCYRQETGITLSKRLDEERWRRAADLLANSDAAVGVVARRVGYTQAASFAQAFRRARGLTPTDFRRRAQQTT